MKNLSILSILLFAIAILCWNVRGISLREANSNIAQQTSCQNCKTQCANLPTINPPSSVTHEIYVEWEIFETGDIIPAGVWYTPGSFFTNINGYTESYHVYLPYTFDGTNWNWITDNSLGPNVPNVHNLYPNYLTSSTPGYWFVKYEPHYYGTVHQQLRDEVIPIYCNARCNALPACGAPPPCPNCKTKCVNLPTVNKPSPLQFSPSWNPTWGKNLWEIWEEGDILPAGIWYTPGHFTYSMNGYPEIYHVYLPWTNNGTSWNWIKDNSLGPNVPTIWYPEGYLKSPYSQYWFVKHEWAYTGKTRQKLVDVLPTWCDNRCNLC